MKLKNLGMKNGNHYNLIVKFVRAFAILTKPRMQNIVDKIDVACRGKYQKEMVVQAINMAPDCNYDQTLSNLVNNSIKVFEAILQAECR